jgi:hypothetical protein
VYRLDVLPERDHGGPTAYCLRLKVIVVLVAAVALVLLFRPHWKRHYRHCQHLLLAAVVDAFAYLHYLPPTGVTIIETPIPRDSIVFKNFRFSI